MTFPFSPALGTILVVARFVGPLGPTRVVLCLDTGATGTTIGVDYLSAAGYDPSQFPAPVPLATGSGMVYAPRLTVTEFFAGTVLTIDFVKGEVTLTAGGPTL
jgi:hypothetical protein